MTTTRITPSKQQAVLNIVAAWLGPRLGHDGPAPTGRDAYVSGLGPLLNPTWDWSGRPTPTILLEGGLDDWAYGVSMDADVIAKCDRLGVFIEPYSGYALSLYRK